MSKIIPKFFVSVALTLSIFNTFSAESARGEIKKIETDNYEQYSQIVTTPIKVFLITCTLYKKGPDAGKIDCNYVDKKSNKNYRMESTEFNQIKKDYEFQQGVLRYGSKYI